MITSLFLAAQVSAPPASDLNWLAGYWLQCADGREVAEYWSDARGGVLFNTTVNLSAEGVASERTVIATVEDRLSFIYEPTGSRTVFPMVDLTGQRAVFENPENDFPNRVIYSREGDVLTGRIEGTIDGQARSMEWTYQAAELNARCPGT